MQRNREIKESVTDYHTYQYSTRPDFGYDIADGLNDMFDSGNHVSEREIFDFKNVSVLI